MTDLSSCPWCGSQAAQKDELSQFAAWECHSYKPSGGEPIQSSACQISVLTRERDEARARLAVKCEHPQASQYAKLWQEDTNRRQMAAVDPKLCDEFPFGCDTMEHVAEALIAAREERDGIQWMAGTGRYAQ